MKKIYERIIIIIVSFFNFIPQSLFSFLKKEELYLDYVCRYYEKKMPYFLSYNLRPKTAEQFICIDEDVPHADKMAVIMTGKLIQEDNFTLETVKLYNKIYPNVLIIISTWESEDKRYIETIKNSTQCHIIQNKEPKFSGFHNFNYQIYAVTKGIEYAKKHNKQYVFKTRCDHRFYKRGLLEYMYNLIVNYPCERDNILGQRYRIIMATDGYSQMNVPFRIGDLYNFGYIDDLYNFWGGKLEEFSLSISDWVKEMEKNHCSWKQQRESAAYLYIRYIKKMSGNTPSITVKESWDFIKKYTIILDRKDVDTFWYKYSSRYEETRRNGEYYTEDSTDKCLSYNWNFSNWLNLYYGSIRYNEEYEKISENNFDL